MPGELSYAWTRYPFRAYCKRINARSAPKVEQLASRTYIAAHQFHEGLTCQCVVCATCHMSIVVGSQPVVKSRVLSRF